MIFFAESTYKHNSFPHFNLTTVSYSRGNKNILKTRQILIYFYKFLILRQLYQNIEKEYLHPLK